MQTKKEFMEELLKTVNRLMGDGYRARIHYTGKINAGKEASLIILNGGNCISPNFYIDKLYDVYKNNRASTLEDIARSIINVYYNNSGVPEEICNIIQEHIDDKEWIEERLFLQLINSGKNKELLKDSLYMEVKGLSLVLYVMVMDSGEETYKMRVPKAMCQQFGWNEREILNYALENTEKLFPYRLFPLHELLQKIPGCTEAESINTKVTEDRMMVLTNNRGVNGAAAAFYPGVLKGISERHGRSLFLLPSSIHEFIILEDDGIYRPEHLESMVKEINHSAVEPEEILSDSLYYYGCGNGVLSVFNNGSFKGICRL